MTETATPSTLADILTSPRIDSLARHFEPCQALDKLGDDRCSTVANSLGGVTGLAVEVRPGWVRGLIEDGKLYRSENRNRYESLGTILRVFHWWFGGNLGVAKVEKLLSAYDRVNQSIFVKTFQEVCG